MRHITYQFTYGFATYDTVKEADRILDVENKGEYIDKFHVSIEEREIIDQPGATLEVVSGELVIEPPKEDSFIPLSNEAAAQLQGGNA